MKNNYILSLILMMISLLGYSQAPTTETFETETVGSTSFIDNGVTFSIVSPSNYFKVVRYPNTGWCGTINDNQYIDNTAAQSANTSAPTISIKTTSNLK